MSDDITTHETDEDREVLDLLFGTTVAERLNQLLATTFEVKLSQEFGVWVSLAAAQCLRVFRTAGDDRLRALDDFIKTGEMEP